MIRHCCEDMRVWVESEDDVVLHWPRSGRYLIPVLDGGSSGVVIRYCPWCAALLPDPEGQAGHRVIEVDDEGDEVEPEWYVAITGMKTVEHPLLIEQADFGDF